MTDDVRRPNRQQPAHLSRNALKTLNKLDRDQGVILLDMRAVKTELARISAALGEQKENDHGETVGTGLVGRHLRLEARVNKRFRSYDDWKHYAVGALAAGTVFLGAIWWLIDTKVEQVLK